MKKSSIRDENIQNKQTELKSNINYYARGSTYQTQGKLDKAIVDFTKAIEINPKNGDTYYSRGRAYQDQNKLDEAITDFTNAIKVTPEEADSYYARGRAYQDQIQLDEAIADFTKAIKIQPKDGDIYYSRGRAYQDQDKLDEAITDFTNAIKVTPEEADSYYARGRAYQDRIQLDEAIADFTKAIEIQPKDGDIYYSRGRAYQDQDKLDEAIADFTKAIEIQPKDGLNYYGRGRVYQNQGKLNEAIADYEYAIKLGVSDSRLMFIKYILHNIADNEKAKKIVSLYDKMLSLRETKIYKGNNPVGHYSKLDIIKYLIKLDDKNKTSNCQPKLRLNNAAYMNDPTEGDIFIEFLKKICNSSIDKIDNILDCLYAGNSQNNNDREILNGESRIYLTSFSKAIDSLPMWVQYSRDGTGACLIFDSTFFDKDDTPFSEKDLQGISPMKYEPNLKEDDVKYCLYDVTYLDFEKYDEINQEESTKLLKKIGKDILDLQDDILNENSPVRMIVRSILDQIRFLYKSKDYRHEKEVRLIKFMANGDWKLTEEQEGWRVPHVYIEVDRELKFKEVILGPKVQNVAEIATYLYYTEKVPKITKSKIKYQ
jgi:tetratricopeptide (TPR) repeat protein